MILGYLTIAVTITAILWRLTHPRHVRVERCTDAQQSPFPGAAQGYSYDEEVATGAAWLDNHAAEDAAKYQAQWAGMSNEERCVELAVGHSARLAVEPPVYGRDQ